MGGRRWTLVRGGRTCGLVDVSEGDVSALAWWGGLHRQGSHAGPLSPGRRWPSLAGLLLRMSGPIPRPRGCSETGHIGYDPLTGWHRCRLPFSLPYIEFPHLQWSSLRTTIAGPMLRRSGPFLCPRRTREITTRASRRDTVWRGGVPQHTIGTRPWCRKAHKALRGVAGLERPSARFKGPLIT